MQQFAEKLSRKEAARYLTQLGYRIAPQTLANMAANNNARGGPPFIKIGWARPVVYSRVELDAWAARRMSRIGSLSA